MKIERINDNQIRCTLTRSDLDDRHLQISELVIGSEKARDLFREMMQMAYDEHGFDAENIPLMVEAVPVSPDCLVLVVTKVENPEELNTRFSHFNGVQPGQEEDSIPERIDDSLFKPADTDPEDDPESSVPDMDVNMDVTLPTVDKFLDYLTEMLKKEQGKEEETARPQLKKQKPSGKKDDRQNKEVPPPSARLFAFSSMEEISALCALIEPFYDGDSALYRHPSEPDFFLLLKKPAGNRSYFDRACRIACDFGSIRPFGYASEAFFHEHYRCLIAEDAVKTLSSF